MNFEEMFKKSVEEKDASKGYPSGSTTELVRNPWRRVRFGVNDPLIIDGNKEKIDDEGKVTDTPGPGSKKFSKKDGADTGHPMPSFADMMSGKTDGATFLKKGCEKDRDEEDEPCDEDDEGKEPCKEEDRMMNPGPPIGRAFLQSRSGQIPAIIPGLTDAPRAEFAHPF